MASVTHTFVFQEPFEETKAHFESTPWAIKLFSDSTLKPFVNTNRVVKPTNSGDTFIARTLATDDTIVAWQSFHKNTPPGQPDRGELITILKLGSGLNGHIDICHGGFTSSLLDEVIGTAADNVRPSDKSTMTAYLKVDYKQPVRTPGVVLCRGWIDRKEGRKLFGTGTIEDGEGTVLATGEALFIVIDRSKVEKMLKL